MQDTVHRSATRFNERLDAFHHVASMVLDVFRKRFAFVVGVSALAGNVDHAVVNDERRDETGPGVELAFVSQLLNTTLRLLSRSGGIGKQPRYSSPRKKRCKTSCKTSSTAATWHHLLSLL